MNTQEQEQFLIRLAVLAEVRGEPMSPTRLEGYTQLLADQAFDDLVPALEEAGRVCRFFPQPIDILDAITTVRYARQETQHKQLVARAPAFGERHCTACEDTGFVRGLDCAGDGRCAVGRCGQPGHASYPHTYTRKCHCRATNPVLAKQREVLRANHHKHEAKRDRA